MINVNIGIKRTSSHETSHTRMSEICEFQVHYTYVLETVLIATPKLTCLIDVNTGNETVLIVTPKLTCLINVNDPQSTNPKYKALILNISSQTKLQLSS